MNALQDINESLGQIDQMLAMIERDLLREPWHRCLIRAERSLLRMQRKLERERERQIQERQECRRKARKRPQDATDSSCGASYRASVNPHV